MCARCAIDLLGSDEFLFAWRVAAAAALKRAKSKEAALQNLEAKIENMEHMKMSIMSAQGDAEVVDVMQEAHTTMVQQKLREKECVCGVCVCVIVPARVSCE